MRIACLGSGSGEAGQPAYDAMVEVGKLLAQGGHIVLTGGFGGAGMEAPARGAKEAGGKTVGYTMLGEKPNQWIMEVGDCAAQYHIGFSAPPIVEVQYGMRLGSLLAADGFIISASGGPGSMVEFMAIINLNAKIWLQLKKIAILRTKAQDGSKGWDYSMLTQLGEWGMFPRTMRQRVLITNRPQVAVTWVTDTTSV